MRKLVVYGLVTVVCGAAVGVALAATEATTFSVKQTTRAERASTGVKFKIALLIRTPPTACRAAEELQDQAAPGLED